MESEPVDPISETRPASPRQRCWALILAGGLGHRFGSERPKAFVEVAGHPLLHWCLLPFVRHEAVTDLLVVVPRGWERAFREEVLGSLTPLLGDRAAKLRGVVPGGEERQDSARLGLKAAYELWQAGEEVRRRQVAPTPNMRAGTAPAAGDAPPPSPEPLVLIHDAARPLVPAGMIDELLETLRAAIEAMQSAPAPKGGRRRKKPREPRPPAVIPVIPAGETLKALDEHRRIGETVSRKGLWRAQTPQAFQLQTILEVHEQAMEAGYEVTDDAMLYEWRDWIVQTIPGSPLSLKVTFPEEAELLGAWFARHSSAAERQPGDVPNGEPR